MAGRAPRHCLQPCCCSSRGASAGVFVVGAEVRKATRVGCDAVMYIVCGRLNVCEDQYACGLGTGCTCTEPVEVYAWRVHDVHVLASLHATGAVVKCNCKQPVNDDYHTAASEREPTLKCE